MSKLDIAIEMRAFDSKDRGFYDSLDEQEQRKFSPYMMLKWGANVSGSADLQEWYIRAQNERVNKDFFVLNRHPKLQWLACTTVSPGMGSHRHYWLKANPVDRDLGNRIKFIEEHCPMLKRDEVQLLANLTTQDELRQLARDMGTEESMLKKIL